MFGRRIGQLIVVIALVVVAAAPASAGAGVRKHAEVTKGAFVTLSGGADLGYEIEGRAVMVRVPWSHGRTFVALHVRGLDPTTVYPVHVHNAPCSADPAGGSHYQHEIGGAVDAVNEIWPAVTTNAAGRGHGSAMHGHWARPEAQSVVIHYPANTSIRLACADLS
jgi:Cu-Zn family superoxide dismutase